MFAVWGEVIDQDGDIHWRRICVVGTRKLAFARGWKHARYVRKWFNRSREAECVEIVDTADPKAAQGSNKAVVQEVEEIELLWINMPLQKAETMKVKVDIDITRRQLSNLSRDGRCMPDEDSFRIWVQSLVSGVISEIEFNQNSQGE